MSRSNRQRTQNSRRYLLNSRNSARYPLVEENDAWMRAQAQPNSRRDNAIQALVAEHESSWNRAAGHGEWYPTLYDNRDQNRPSPECYWDTLHAVPAYINCLSKITYYCRCPNPASHGTAYMMDRRNHFTTFWHEVIDQTGGVSTQGVSIEQASRMFDQAMRRHYGSHLWTSGDGVWGWWGDTGVCPPFWHHMDDPDDEEEWALFESGMGVWRR